MHGHPAFSWHGIVDKGTASREQHSSGKINLPLLLVTNSPEAFLLPARGKINLLLAAKLPLKWNE
jgi:hypothetical protein